MDKPFCAKYSGDNFPGYKSPVLFRIDHQKNLTFGYHNHDFWEFMFVQHGSVTNNFENETKVLKKNELCILAPSTAHSVRNLDKTFILFNFEVKTSFIEEICKTLGANSPCEILPKDFAQFSLNGREVNEFVEILNKLHNEYSYDNKNDTILRILITKFITKAVMSNQTQQNVKNPIIQKMLQELKNIDNFQLSIKDVCDKLKYSHEYITRLFNKENLDAPSKIFLNTKLSYACTLLSNSTLSIIDVANLCGIYSLSYFNKSFKNYCGVTPSVFRKQNNLINK